MIAPGSDTWPPQEALAIQTKYELDPFQKHAVLGIHAGDHVFVTAKTGSGKTFVGEYLIAYWLARGKRVFYTTPIKSLSNQKYHDLKKLFPAATVGILTGDIKMCPDAQIVVMTAEILRNLFYKRGTATEGVGLTAAVSLEGVAGVVMDEVHYIQDPDRGHVWEESLILCPREIQLVLLSATLPSAASLAGWLANLHQRRTWLLSTTYRIVPLVHGVLTPTNTVVPLLDTQGRWIGDAYTGWLRDRKAVATAAGAHSKAVAARRADGYSGGAVTGKVRVEDPVTRLLRTVAWLDQSKQMPALFFIFSRKDCERYAALMVGSLLDSSDAAAAAHIIDFHLSRHRAALETSPQYHRIRDFLVRGIAFHHSGLQPLLKEIVEILFTRGYVKVLFATETFSVGLNMPTKTVVFLELEKWTDGPQGPMKRLLRPDEYIQMAGRAGRRGLDTQGLVLYEPMRDPVEPSELKGLLTGALPPLTSRMRFHYDFILKQRADSTIAEQSYWAVQQREGRSGLGREIEDVRARVSAAAVLVSPAEEALLAAKLDLEVQVAQNVNAKRKKAQVALNQWLGANDSKDLGLRVKRYEELCGLRRELAYLESQASAWDAAPLLALEPQEECLRDWGFLTSDTRSPVTTLGLMASDTRSPVTTLGLMASDTRSPVTTLGLMASETNEGHCILMPLLAASGKTAALSGEDIACVLAYFLREGNDESTLNSADLSEEVSDVLTWIEKQARACQATEDKFGVFSPSGFWNLSPLWVCVVSRWLDNTPLTLIAAEFGMFEGNVQRGLLRVANLLEEWGALATLRQDLATLEKLSGLRFLRNEVIVDSLYLRL